MTRRHGPKQRGDQRQRVDAEIVDRAMARRPVALYAEHRIGVGHEIFVHLDADVVHPADRASFQQRLDLPDHRVLDVIVAQRRDAPGGFGGVGHSARIGKARRHRLFAPDVLAGLERGDRHLRVELVRRRDRHHVDFRVDHQRSPV